MSFTSTSVDYWCRLFGYRRANYYKSLKRRAKAQLEEEIIIKLVIEHRGELVNTGLRKTYEMIKDFVAAQNIKMGRDRLADILRANNLLVKAKKSYTITTLTNGWRHRYDDLRIDLVPTASEQLWVADITYIRTEEGFEYLSIITDAYSKFIVGWCSFPTLETAGCLQALNMALEAREYPQRSLIHHSDRGAQYCSEKYTQLLLSQDISISVTQNGSPYENPMAESVNSILKVELDLDQTFKSRVQARKVIDRKMYLYNEKRLHGSIDYLTPSQAYHLQGHINKRW